MTEESASPRPEGEPEQARNTSTSIRNSKIGRSRSSIVPGFSGPRELNRLLLLEPIARGGMGEVYLAATGDIEGAERPCVVKLIRQDHRDDASFLARFLDEARIQAQMQHPGVAQILEAAIDPEGQPYVVVEYVPGRDLAELRRRAQQLKLNVGWADAVAIAASIADALAHVHERTDAEGRPLEVVHRDLSPQNIMVSYGGETKLIDFGTARGENRRCQTINGIVFAKPGYVAPEVAANNPGGAPADLYALGIVLWELIAGRRFLQGDSQEHLAGVAKGERNPPALSLWLALPKELDGIIARMTAHRIEDRYASARQAAEALHELCRQAPSLANGERGVRARIAHLMLRLYPAEPTQSRAHFAKLVAHARSTSRKEALKPARRASEAPAETEQEESLLPGTRYRVLRQIEKSAMSVVYEADHLDLGRKVALKVLDGERCQGPEAEARFRDEARVVARLKHDNLVQIHDFGVARDGRPYYAMEYLEGETLAQRLERSELGRLPWREAVELTVQACQALEAAHAQGIVHRDIKPANLFLESSGTLKLLDFGITRTSAEVAPERGESLRLLGTPEYMAPEQIGRHDVDARADVYALGAVLYEMLCGKLPHAGKSTVALLDNKMSDEAVAPSRRVKRLGLPRYLDRVVLTALATEVGDRYDDVTCFRQDLAWILETERETSGAGRRWVLAGGATAVAASIVALLAFDGLPEPMLASRDVEPRENLADATLDKLEAVVQTLRGSRPTASLASGAAAPAATPRDFGGDPRSGASVLAQAAETTDDGAPGEDGSVEREASAELAGPAPAGGTTGDEANAEEPANDDATKDEPANDGAMKDEPANDGAADDEPATGGAASDEPANDEAADDEPEGADDQDDSPSRAEPPEPSPARSAELERALASARSLMDQRQNLRALAAYRELGKRYPRDPEVLAGWSKIAARNKWWGESLKVAEAWAKLDDSLPAALHLARTQRRLGQVDRAIATLRDLLRRHPETREGKDLLYRYGGSPIALK